MPRLLCALLSAGVSYLLFQPALAASAPGKPEGPRVAAGEAVERTPIEQMAARVKAAGDAARHDADAVVVLDETSVRVRPSGIGTARRHLVTKVLREAALRGLSVQGFGFDPHTNRLELIAVRVYRADGTVEEVPLDTAVLQPQAAHSIFWGTQQYLVSVPRLAVGDAVETVADMTGFNVAYLVQGLRDSGIEGFRGEGLRDSGIEGLRGEGAAGEGSRDQGIKGSREAAGSTRSVSDGSMSGGDDVQLNALGQPLEPPVAGHWHDEAQFWTTSYPILEKRYTVRVPKDKPLQYGVYNGELRAIVMLDGDDVVYTFEKQDLKPLKGESNMEPWPNVAPKLLLATLPTWEDKSRWLYAVSEPQLGADDAIRAKVAEIIKDCRTDEEKWTALNHWVAENIRYAGTSRGMCEGYTIHTCEETFHDRAGVCKDKAGMLCGMLRVAGFDSFVVMTMARQRVDEVPADQFNHAVTCVRHEDGTLTLLDPTWMPKSRDNWSTLEPLQHVVYGLPEGKGLSLSPYFPPETSTVAWKAESEVDAEGGVSGSVQWSATGAPEGRTRRTLAGIEPAQRETFFAETWQRLASNARLRRLECMDPVDFSGPLTIQAEYAAPEFALEGGERRYLALPMMQTPLGTRAITDLFGDTGAKERQYGLKLWATRRVKIEETVKLPLGWKVVEAPQAVELDGPAAGLKFKLERKPGDKGGRVLQYTCELRVKKWTVPPEEYANFKEVIEKFEELTGRVVVCSTEAGDE